MWYDLKDPDSSPNQRVSPTFQDMRSGFQGVSLFQLWIFH